MVITLGCTDLACCPWGTGTLAEAPREVGGGSASCLSNWTTGRGVVRCALPPTPIPSSPGSPWSPVPSSLFLNSGAPSAPLPPSPGSPGFQLGESGVQRVRGKESEGLFGHSVSPTKLTRLLQKGEWAGGTDWWREHWRASPFPSASSTLPPETLA